MKNMRFAVSELKSAIQANLETHRTVFLEAQEGYRAAMIRELDTRLNEAKSGKRIVRVAFLPEPEDHTREYNRVLKMLSMCTEEHVELNEEEFGQYVMDDWGWKRQFLMSNSNYSMTATAMLAASGDDD